MSAESAMEMLKPVADMIDAQVIEKLPAGVREQLTALEGKNPAFKPAYVVGGIALLPLFLIIYALGGFKLVINLVGFVYPAYKSFMAIESKSKEDDTQWLTYWVVYGVFNILEHAMAFVVMMIPYYGLFKMGFLIFCYHPNTMGATQVYTKVLKPYVVPYVVREKAE
eukprot:CAMPEP_0205920364 /NCGR_PEP_ID=MMETSP1325-20131115/11088_1 /ASSEMBLY_ACC=CAM_ASM_000708 /TAXON_ID=236786 /ORGANISM="Florenciella sp., Strain RCC1007" /LENGTH=166 /DNA_ID=CAMNT_0053288047 /DNA_START=18 /DNA_END=518 /DNA_ORIENTATION=+